MAHRALSATLAVIAVAGWSFYGFATSSSEETERELRAQVAEIRNDQAKIAGERDHLRAQVAEMEQANEELTAFIKEEAAKAEDALDTARPDQLPLERAAAAEGPAADAAPAAGAVLTAAEIEASVRTAQAVLTRLGFGPLVPDGVMGPRTRNAIEAFERANGLTVTGELGRQTVEALKGKAQAVLQPPVEKAQASADEQG